MKTFYWHDYETWGADPSLDRPSQFAGVRTDESLNIVSEPLVVYCQPPVDVWPTPEACLVTGITPQQALENGIPEKDFIHKIHAEFSVPQTCVAGYNSIRFDDEVTRYTLYRNFYDPYEREWRNGNSRWDIIDVVRLTYALRPEGIEWPVVDGKPSFKLENLTVANNIDHGAAHDAYSDVAATIGLAKMLRDKKPALFEYALKNTNKKYNASFIDIVKKKPLLHVSSRFSAEHGCAALVVPLAMHPVNKNAVVVYDLSVDPESLIDLPAEDIRQRVFVSQENLPEGVKRIPLKLVHLNKCPILATPKLLDDKVAKRLRIDKAQCEKNWFKIRAIDFSDKLRELYLAEQFPPRQDPERQLYDGFLNNQDRPLLETIRKQNFNLSDSGSFVFEDSRYGELLFRYRARYFSESLTTSEQKQWFEFVAQRLLEGDEPERSYERITKRIAALLDEYSQSDENIKILRSCQAYMQSHMSRFS